MLRCFVLCCVPLCCVALRIGLLQWSSNCCSTFVCLHCKHNTTQHNTTQHNTTQHNTKQHNTTQHNTTQHNTTQHNTTQHNTTQHNTTQHNTTQHNTTQHNTTQQKICGFLCCHRGDRGGGYFSGPCWACVNTTQEGVGGYFLPLCWPAVLTRLISSVLSLTPQFEAWNSRLGAVEGDGIGFKSHLELIDNTPPPPPLPSKDGASSTAFDSLHTCVSALESRLNPLHDSFLQCTSRLHALQSSI